MTGHEHISRLRWACRRGMRELDLWLQGYLDNGYTQASTQAQHDFTRLLDFPDQDLFDWLMGHTQPADASLLDILEQIRTATHQAARTG